ncbi:inclusion body family protein [Candidatus Electronema sp. JM]|uniref:inclusion body family protein n=1 Tax=Candidatus Electronema sp. JM TaxID=3401571 RepID=UPI003AA7EE72
MALVEIEVLVVIDTNYIFKNYQNPSRDASKPTGINHSSQYMITNSQRGIVSGQGTADLSFKANVGDIVSFVGTSIEANSDSAVIIYGINHWSGDKVFNQFVPNLITRNRAVMPNNTTPNGLPAVQQQINFASFDAKVSRSGKENFYVNIAVYKLADDGQAQDLYGYFYWDPTITVPA